MIMEENNFIQPFQDCYVTMEKFRCSDTDIEMNVEYPGYNEPPIVVNKMQQTCQSKKNLSPKRFSKRRAASRVSRKSRHRRQQHRK